MNFIKIFITFFGLLSCLRPLTVKAQDKIIQEVFLKKMNQRLMTVLNDSTEARIFLEEDLSEAGDFFARARIQWLPTFDLGAKILTINGTAVVALSKHYSFIAHQEDQIEMIVDFLFQIKRQIEGSNLLIPQIRIKLFAQKFAPILMKESDNCSLSLFPLNIGVSESARTDFILTAFNNLGEKDFTYQSKWSRWIMMIESRETIISGCLGKGRSKIIMKASLFDWKNLSAQRLAEISGTACEDLKSLKEKLLKKISKQINKKLFSCQQQDAL